MKPMTVMRTNKHHEEGQIIPVLLVVLFGLAAAAVLLFQIGKTASLAAEATSAADAAALAAAYSVRDQLHAQVVRNGYADLDLVDMDSARVKAEAAARKNGGTVTALERSGLEVTAFVETLDALEDDASPLGAEGTKATTTATAELKPSYVFPGTLPNLGIAPVQAIEDADWEAFAKQIEGKPLDIVALGVFLQSLGFHVSEHPAFGGVCYTCHVTNSWHYRNGAIDVNYYLGDEMAAIDAIVGHIRALGYHVLWRVEDHFDHLHVDIGAPGAPGEYAGSGYGPAVFEVILVD
jgi:hypothetical protein